ncbi:MAG: hypothetical protein U0610_17870 [bacterium]
MNVLVDGDARPLPEAAAWLATVRIAAADDPARWEAASEVRPPDIHPAEWLEAELLTDPRRRAQWLAGRRAAKLAVARVLGARALDPATLAVRSRDRFGRPARPALWSRGERLGLHVSVAHAEHLAAAVASPTHLVGVDVVERADVGEPDPWTWSAREAAYKAELGDEAFVPDDWHVEREPDRVHGTATDRRARGRAVRVRWLGDVPGAHLVAVGFRAHERSSA